MSQQKLLKRLLSILDENNIDYMVTGSIVSSLQGEPRATHDIAIVVQIQVSSIRALIAAFNLHVFICLKIVLGKPFSINQCLI